jgi:hypothetical protein
MISVQNADSMIEISINMFIGKKEHRIGGLFRKHSRCFRRLNHSKSNHLVAGSSAYPDKGYGLDKLAKEDYTFA